MGSVTGSSENTAICPMGHLFPSFFHNLFEKNLVRKFKKHTVPRHTSKNPIINLDLNIVNVCVSPSSALQWHFGQEEIAKRLHVYAESV
jgi:hypothetical protein